MYTHAIWLRSLWSVNFRRWLEGKVFRLLIGSSFCTATSHSPHQPAVSNSGFPKKCGNWGNYHQGILRKNRRQAFPLHWPYTFKLASPVLPQHALKAQEKWAPHLHKLAQPPLHKSIHLFFRTICGVPLLCHFSLSLQWESCPSLWISSPSSSQTWRHPILSVVALMLNIFPPQNLWL